MDEVPINNIFYFINKIILCQQEIARCMDTLDPYRYSKRFINIVSICRYQMTSVVHVVAISPLQCHLNSEYPDAIKPVNFSALYALRFNTLSAAGSI
jgi:hypothetical protein